MGVSWEGMFAMREASKVDNTKRIQFFIFYYYFFFFFIFMFNVSMCKPYG